MANVHKTESGAWECRWSAYEQDKDGKVVRKQQRKVFGKGKQAKADADQHARDMENRVATHQSIDQAPGRVPLRTWASRWLDSLDGKKKQSTLRGYRKILDRSVLPVLGHRPVAGITTYDVEQFIDHLTDTGKAAPTVRRHYGVLRGALNYAARHRAIPVNPCIGAELPADHRTDRMQPRALTPSEVEKLAAVLDEQAPYGLMIRFMAYTGLRAGEVAGLNVGDLDLLRRKITVVRTRTKVKGGWEITTPKNGKTRIMPIPRWLGDQLAAYLAQHPYGPHGANDRDHPLFPGRRSNDTERFKHATGGVDFSKPWERDAFYKRQFKPALAAAGLPPTVRIHDLRHTAGSIMLDSGIDRYKVAMYLGHSVQVLETIYAHLIDDGANDMDRLTDPALHANLIPTPLLVG